MEETAMLAFDTFRGTNLLILLLRGTKPCVIFLWEYPPTFEFLPIGADCTKSEFLSIRLVQL